ncbi:MAG: hypothetical protein N5P05_003257 [Chroococcopsis gigantea SAG 12.99]|jgi:predicted NACHT family NTPase|nr:NACHT domain-containing NTPase [Chlorogloea purpurea SAG 13.99]MDV3001651.1 hypothetical protein [Chroococcopsis gigantea SAG 12.99]
MTKRSLNASPEGIKLARQAFYRKGWTQENLAGEVNVKTRQPIWRFFSGRPIERITFIEICSVLELEWREIAVDPPQEIADPIEPSLQNLNLLVKEVRARRKNKILSQCGTLQLLDVNHPVEIENIYIDVNILEEIVTQQAFDITTMQNLPPSEVDRFGLGEISRRQITGAQAVENYSKLRVLGKPGSGKTTFLQYLTIECNRGNFAADRVPVFITLRDFADESRKIDNFSFLNYIRSEFLTSGISAPETLEILLREGRILLLMDGLDEILDRDIRAVLTEIRRFSENYQKNFFVTTCRTSGKSFNLKGFTDVEIAPFTPEQMIAFSLKWFVSLTRSNKRDGLEKANQFIEKLNLPENLSFRQLSVTPLFLHLSCWLFDRHDKFPFKKSDFYKQCLDLLLTKWDEFRGIQRDEIYRGLILPQKIRLLSQIAATTFERGDYFFEKSLLEQYISDYIRSLPDPLGDEEELQLDSEAILKAIELQHGILSERVLEIFSFSSLAFQEYFTARKIVATHNLEALESTLERLVSHITEPRWREIFLLTAMMLRSADALVQLMKQRIDALVAQDAYLQEFLTWANQKSSTTAPPSLSATRAFYLALTQTPHIASHFALACTLDGGIFLDGVLDNLVLECSFSGVDFAGASACADSLTNALSVVVDSGLQRSLQVLRSQIPESVGDREKFLCWWRTNHLTWAETLRAVISKYRNIEHDWNFSPAQKGVLENYYTANKLLMDCLNSNAEVTLAVRQEIEAALLLSQKELEEREWK